MHLPSQTRAVALLTLLAQHVLPVSAASNMVPDFEVKLLLNATAVLDPTNPYKLKPSVLSAFSMPTTVTKMNVQFLDTSTKQIYTAGWSPRIRKTEGEPDFELTYKKRYPVNTSLSNGIDVALSTANTEGFDSTDTNWDAQIEWGYSQKTLSISRKKTDSKSGYSGMDLPGKSDSRDLLISNAPGKFQDWGGVNNWGTDLLAVSRIYGPVLAKRSIGTWSGLDIYIEVWPIKDVSGTGIEYIVEASFKTGSISVADTKSGDLQTYLTSNGWFLPGDSLKTGLIMDRY